jgi:hypothetical protein
MAGWISVGCTAAVLALAGVAGAGSGAAPPLLGLTGGRLVALNPRTLTPLSSPRPLALSVHGSPLLALSPDGRRLAVVPRGNNSDDLIVVDRLRLRVVRTVRPDEALLGDWDVAWGTGGSIILVKSESLERGPVFGRCIPAVIGGGTDISAGVATRTADGVVFLFGGSCGGGDLVLWPYTSDAEFEVDLALTLDPATPVAIAVDAHRRRVFLISSTGAIAVVGLRTNRAEYHSVKLPAEIDGGDTYRAAWAGNGHIAFWGPSGLTLIDSRTWTTHLLDPAATDVAVAPNALLAWNQKAATGITVYKPDGSLRYRLLPQQTVRGVRTSPRYAYITSQGCFSVDLHTGQVTGPLTSRTRLVLPDVLELP